MRLIDADDAVRRSREPSIYDLTDVPDFLAECPTVDAEPVRHGEWETSSERPDCLICSLCDCAFDMWLHEKKDFKYCPNCGAKMDRGEQHAGNN